MSTKCHGGVAPVSEMKERSDDHGHQEEGRSNPFRWNADPTVTGGQASDGIYFILMKFDFMRGPPPISI